MELPLFPLHTVLLPGGILPLRIFEARYLDMVSSCMRNDGGFGVCLLKGGTETGKPMGFHHTGSLVKIVDWEKLPDGLLGITGQGEQKIRILDSRLQADGLVIGEAELIDDEPEAPLPEEYAVLGQLLETILTEVGPPYSELGGDYNEARWVGSRLVELLPLDFQEKQKLLEMDDPLARVAQLHDAVDNMRYS